MSAFTATVAIPLLIAVGRTSHPPGRGGSRCISLCGKAVEPPRESVDHAAAEPPDHSVSVVNPTGNTVYNLRTHQVIHAARSTRILSFQDHRKIAVTDERGRPRRDAEGKRVYRYERLPTPVVRQYTVFNAEQADGLPARANPTPEPLWKVHQQAERVLEDSGVPVRHVAGDRAFYNLNRDEIVLPERGQFPSANHYYQTALHELGHSTGHPERMNRETLVQGIEGGFGSPDYAKEELRAEISAMMTGERVGVGHDPSRGAAYVEGWIQALEEDPREIRRAAADAQKISDFVLSRHREREAAREPVAVAAIRAPAPERIVHPVPPLPVPQRTFGPRR